MENYYDEIIGTINKLIQENNIEKAKKVLNIELDMPYIPKKYEEIFNEIKKDINNLSHKEINTELSIQQIEEYLYEDDTKQIQAVSNLFQKNLRNCIDIIQNYFLSKPCKEAASLLIEALIQQKISYNFIYIKNNIEYTFNPCYIELPYETDGFKQAKYLIEKWLIDDNPTLCNMVVQHLLHKAYTYLPLEISDDEAEHEAIKSVENICELMSCLDIYETIIKKYNIKKYLKN